jgi:hypothetical protein
VGTAAAPGAHRFCSNPLLEVLLRGDYLLVLALAWRSLCETRARPHVRQCVLFEITYYLTLARIAYPADTLYHPRGMSRGIQRNGAKLGGRVSIRFRA